MQLGFNKYVLKDDLASILVRGVTTLTKVVWAVL